MGLAIHFDIKPNPSWTWDESVAKLRAAHAFAATLPLSLISADLIEGDKARIDNALDSSSDVKEEESWFFIQSMKHVRDASRPGESWCQNPVRVMGFWINPADGCEDMNIGIAEYPETHVEPNSTLWTEGQFGPTCCYWKSVLNDPKYHKDSAKIIRTFMKKYNLKKVAKNRKFGDRFYNKGIANPSYKDKLYSIPILMENGQLSGRDMASVGIVRGKYRSHRQGHEDNMAIVKFDDPSRNGFGHPPVMLQFTCTESEAREIVKSEEFQSEFKDLVLGKPYTQPAEISWSAFCKTQYASNPRFGGAANFLKAHKTVILMLDHMEKLGFTVNVKDEGGFYEKRDDQALVEEVAEWNGMIAAMCGAMKDDLGNSGYKFESPIGDFPNFEQLEHQWHVNNVNADEQLQLKQLHTLSSIAKKIVEETQPNE